MSQRATGAVTVVGSTLLSALALVAVATPVRAALPRSAPLVTEQNYVALGDSYAAGPDIPTQQTDPSGCLRSSSNYAHDVAAALNLNLTDVTCSSATTGSMTQSETTSSGTNPPQLSALTSSTAVVTITLGGDNLGFASILENCIAVTPDGPTVSGVNCKDHYDPGGDDTLADAINATAPQMGIIFRQIHADAPAAKVFVVGYPDILPNTGTGCWPTMPFTTTDAPYLRGVELELNAMLASEAAANGAVYVDTYTPSENYNACTSASTRWVEPIIPTNPGYPVHPNATGEAGMAGLVESAMLATTTKATVGPTTATTGHPVTYSASVAAAVGTPTGSVTFTTGGLTLCTATLTSGTASCSADSAPIGADTVTAAYAGAGGYPASSGKATVVVTAVSGPLTAVAPVRICDTRAGNPSGLTGQATQCDGTAQKGETLAPGVPLSVGAGGFFGVPATATAAVFNVTAIQPRSAGYLSVYATGQPVPTASSLNFVPGTTVADLVEVQLGTGGDVSFVTDATTDLAVDLEGYVTPASLAGAGLYNALATPARICDTRPGNPSNLAGGPDGPAQCNGVDDAGSMLVPGVPLDIQAAGVGGVPATGVSAVVLNVTAADPAAAGFLAVYPGGGAVPMSSNVNFRAGQTVPNRVIVPVSGAGQVSVIAEVATDAVVDVSGWYSAAGGSGSQFTPEPAPVRICDTRAGNPSGLSGGTAQCNGPAGAGAALGPGQTMTIAVTGLAGVPTGAGAVVLNVTGISPTAATYLVVFPGSVPPYASDLNPAPGEVEANLVVATLSASGTLTIYNNAGTVNLVVDVDGWYG